MSVSSTCRVYGCPEVDRIWVSRVYVRVLPRSYSMYSRMAVYSCRARFLLFALMDDLLWLSTDALLLISVHCLGVYTHGLHRPLWITVLLKGLLFRFHVGSTLQLLGPRNSDVPKWEFPKARGP